MPEELEHTAQIVASFVSHNRLAVSELPDFIAKVHEALTSTAAPAVAPTQQKATPAQIRKSITPDALISFEDGRPYRLLKRHLNGLGMTPADYREKWGLPKDYPITAPSYAAKRSELAKTLGLGKRISSKVAEPVVEAPAKPVRKRATKAAAAEGNGE